MKRSGSGLLLFIILFNIGGVFLIFMIQRSFIYEKVSQNLHSEKYKHQIQLISFSKETASRIDWKHRNKEFRYVGKMYDVVKTVITSDSIFFYCYHDKEETKLFAWLEKSLKKEESSATRNVLGNILKSFTTLYYFCANENFKHKDAFCLIHIIPKKNLIYKPPYVELLNPPPWQS